LQRSCIESSSSESEDDGDDDESSEDDDSSAEGDDPVYGGVLDLLTRQKETEETVDVTYDESTFLAVTNLDWAHVRAVDIFTILSSFALPGAVKRVQVFLSDCGKEKQQQDLQQGPPSLRKKTKKSKKRSGSDDEEEEEDEHEDESVSDGLDHDKSEMDEDEESKSSSDNDDSPEHSDGEDDASGSNRFDADDQCADFIQTANQQAAESDFDPEKLRACEASKLKCFFCRCGIQQCRTCRHCLQGSGWHGV